MTKEGVEALLVVMTLLFYFASFERSEGANNAWARCTGVYIYSKLYSNYCCYLWNNQTDDGSILMYNIEKKFGEAFVEYKLKVRKGGFLLCVISIF